MWLVLVTVLDMEGGLRGTGVQGEGLGKGVSGPRGCVVMLLGGEDGDGPISLWSELRRCEWVVLVCAAGDVRCELIVCGGKVRLVV